jgi:hypothetical protein
MDISSKNSSKIVKHMEIYFTETAKNVWLMLVERRHWV